MAQLLLQFDVQYTTPNLQKEMLPTASPTTQLIPPIQHNNMYREHKNTENECEPAPNTSRYTHSNEISSTSCSLSVSCRLVKNKIKHHLEHYQQHSNTPMFSEKTQKENMSESCCKLNSYSKVKFKSTPLRINHRKNNKSKCSRINSVILAVMKNMFPLYNTIANSSFLSNFCKTKSATSRNMKSSSTTTGRTRFMWLPSLGATSFITLMTIVCLETVLLSTMSSCAKTFYMHWNTSNSIFRIDNTDHIIDVNKGNLAFEFDQVHIICPVYEPGTFENETEKYIIYNVSKVEYETCRITNADPRVIAICDKPHKLMFFTITFRPFTPQPGGLEFLPGNDYYFISTSSKDDLYRRIGGRCSTNNMKVVFKVCCAPEEKNKTMIAGGNASGNPAIESSGGNTVSSSGDSINIDVYSPTNTNKQLINNIHGNGINTISTGLIPTSGININSAINTGIQLKPINGGSGTSINTNVDQFNRIPMQTNGINVIGSGINSGVGLGSHGGNGIMLTPGVGIGQFPGLHGQTGIRINNVPPQHHYPTHKSNNDDLHHYDKHPNEVVKNEELTYNSGGHSIHKCSYCTIPLAVATKVFQHIEATRIRSFITEHFSNIINSLNSKQTCNNNNKKLFLHLSFNPIILISILLLLAAYCSNNYSLSKIRDSNIFFKNKSNSRSVTSSNSPSQTYSWLTIKDPKNCLR